jgi:hypothetical protein
MEMMDAVLEVAGGAIGLALAALVELISIVLSLFGALRELTANERSAGVSVYEDTIPFDEIRVYEGSFVSGLSELFRDKASAVTTMRIIHIPSGFDFDDPNAETKRQRRHTMIHEMGHVWQGQNTGPYYISHSLFDQATMGQAAYDYKMGAASEEQSLIDHRAQGLSVFNPEQQAQIIADFYDRREHSDDTTAWQPYIDEVRAAA